VHAAVKTASGDAARQGVSCTALFSEAEVFCRRTACGVMFWQGQKNSTRHLCQVLRIMFLSEII